MTTIYFDSSSDELYNEHHFFSPSDQYHEHQLLSPNSQGSSSSNSLTCHLFFNPITTHDQDGYFNRESSHPSQIEDDSFGSQAYVDHHVENKDERVEGNDELKLSWWKRETYDHMNDENQLKWMSSKMRVMLKMKKTDPTKLNASRSTTNDPNLEDHHDHKEPTSPEDEKTINSTYANNNIPIRVCSDCSTTKTPLWRSGPKGPKSLCNACGIRQRKARKAMAMAMAAAVETSKNVFNDNPTTSLKATKVLHKDHKKPNNATKYKKKQYSEQRKNRVEELLLSLSKNLVFHRVFPQDEKEAAILLMTLSSGYVH